VPEEEEEGEDDEDSEDEYDKLVVKPDLDSLEVSKAPQTRNTLPAPTINHIVTFSLLLMKSVALR